MNARQHKRRQDARRQGRLLIAVRLAIIRSMYPAEPEDDDWDDEPCDRCGGDTMDPYTDYLLPCPVCMGEQRT
jgi:hypothetical protein